MKIIESIFKILIGLSFILSIGYMGYQYGNAQKQSVSDYFWIDNDKVNIDSEVYPSPLYDNTGDIIGSIIMIRTDKGDSFKEFLDTDYGTWKELQDSWIMAFKQGGLK